MDEDLFRKSPFESFSSLYRTDQLLRVVRARGWISLFCLAFLVVALGIWASLAEIPIYVVGKGVLFAPDNVMKIQNFSPGVVEKLKIKEGEFVKKGDLVAVLDNSPKQFEYEEKKAQIASLQEELSGYKALLSEEKEIQLRSGQKVLENQREKVKELIEWIHREGDTPSSYPLKIELSDALSAIAAQEMEISLIKKEILSLTYADKVNSLSQQLALNRAEAQRLSQELSSLEIFAPADGSVIQVSAIPGELLSSNSDIGWIQTPLSPGCCQVVYAFLPLEAGEKVKKGMLAKIELASVDSQKYGMLLGKVKEILPYPASEEESRLRLLPSPGLRKYLVSDSLSLLVLIDLLPNRSTPTGYQWTSPHGPPFMVMPGTVAQVRVVLEQKKPISYIFPFFGSSS